MIDLKVARGDAERIRSALARRGAAEDFDRLLTLDQQRRDLLPQVEGLRSRRRPSSGGRPSAAEMDDAREAKAELDRLEPQLAEVERTLADLSGQLPNIPDPSAPDGDSEDDALVLRVRGELPRFAFEPRDSLALAAGQGGIDMERGARMAGARFAYRTGDVALTELALYRFVLDRLVRTGFVPMLPPVIANERAMYGTGFLPTEESNLYRLEGDALYLSGTSEVALAAFHMDERLPEDELPLRYAAYSTNFRREAGAAGRDTRGMFRVHQFDKVEMFIYCTPEQSGQIHEELLAIEESIIGDLALPYRVVNVAVGDLGAPAAKKYDIEAWFPSQRRYREVTSCSDTTSYQARRLNIRVRREDGRLEFAHTLNGTGVTARALLSILENFQDEDASVVVPPCLHPFGAPERIAATSRA
jgi:seryl-tRNA synthetase